MLKNLVNIKYFSSQEPEQHSNSKPYKILVIGPAWVGDMVMAQSLFQDLKLSNPNTVIDVLAPDWSRPLLERMPEVNAAFALSVPHGVLNLRLRYQLAQNLKPNGYDQAIVLPNSWKSALIPCWANIPKRTGFRGEMRFGLLNDLRILNKNAIPRMVERFVALGRGSDAPVPNPKDTPIPSLKTDPNSVQEALVKFSIALSLKKPILGLCPGAEFGSSKRWPEHYFANLAEEKLKEGWSVWLFGSKNDMPVSAQIQKSTKGRCVDLTGITSLGEAIDLLSLTTVVVSNDSGLMHIASALNKPLIAIYGSTDPEFTPPLTGKARIVRLTLPCSPCFKRECPLEHHHCMRDLSPVLVLNTLKSLGTACGF